MRDENRRPRVLICDPIAPEGVAILEQVCDVLLQTEISQEELLKAIVDCEAVVVRSATRIDAEVIAHGLRLKVIGRAGAGLDNIDVAAAQERGIEVVNSPDANTLAVAEHTMALMLAAARRLPRADLSLKAGKWEKKLLVGTGLAGKTLGIVGFGRIGRQVAIRARAFGMRILVNQRRPTPELNLEAGVEAVDLVDLLRQSDFVTLHVPLRPETRHLIGQAQLALMKPNAMLINTARGDVVDETALLQALNDGTIAGAALDVFVEEPATHSALAQHERVIATPHIAASTEDAQRSAAVTVAEQIVDVLKTVEVETVLPLRVVEMERIVPHEHIDPKRVDRLAKRLESEKYLNNPPVVTEMGDRYMLLDGATRTAALKQLGYQHGVVQVISLQEGLRLHTWYHVIREVEPHFILGLLSALPNISLEATEPERAADAMFDYGALCYLQMVSGEAHLVYAAQGTNRLDALNALTECYIQASHVSRTLKRNFIALQHEYPDMTALVVFPEYTVAQVIQVAQSGRRFPAGITRFIIPGRVLQLRADLAYLRSDHSLRDKNRWLHEMLVAKSGAGKIRYYEEPVYLLDE